MFDFGFPEMYIIHERTFRDGIQRQAKYQAKAHLNRD